MNRRVAALAAAVAGLAVALGVGSLELLQVATGRLLGVDLSSAGYPIVGLFALTWACSVALWKGKRIEERWPQNPNSPRATTTAEPPTSTRSMRSPSPSAVA
jgi:hypothetical protein